MRIVLAIDLHGDETEVLVDRGAAWAARFDATLDLVWVDPFGRWKPFTLDRALAKQLEQDVERARQRDRDHLQALLDRVPEPNRGQARALTGEPAREIPEAARGYDALLLGPGTQLGDRLGLGSLESGIIRRAPCTVLVLRELPDEQPIGVETGS